MLTGANSVSPKSPRAGIDKIWEDRIIWGDRPPFLPTTPAVSFIGTAPITEKQREKIAHGNAERIFRIPPAASGRPGEAA